MFAIVAELAQPRWGAIQLSANGVWRVLRRHGLSTRARRYGLVCGCAAPPQPQRPEPAPERHPQVDHPGELVQFDCFCIGRLSGTKCTVWQYTAIDVASAYAWATLQVTRRNPSATWTSALARRVAADLAARGWRLERVMSDNAQRVPLGHLPGHHRRPRRPPPLHPRRSTPDERVRGAGPADHPGRVLEARLCPLPDPKQTGLRLDLGRYLRYYNTERAHTGRRTKGRTPTRSSGRPSCGTRTTDGSPQPGTGQANEPPSTAHSRPMPVSLARWQHVQGAVGQIGARGTRPSFAMSWGIEGQG